MTYIIECQDLEFSYRRRRVLRGASWRVGRGVTALLGPNGAGKTTLLRCLAGLASPTEGSICVAGRAVTDAHERPAAQRLLGFLPQMAALPGMAQVRDTVSYAAWLSAVPSNEIPARVDDALVSMGAGDLARRRVRTLSGGQRQRVALASSVVHDPRVMVLDEPTVGLDPAARLAVREQIARIGQERAVLLATHLTEDAERLADRVGVLVGGTVRYDGTWQDFLDSYACSDSASALGSEFERAYSALMSEQDRQR